jgi:hypothetical protein
VLWRVCLVSVQEVVWRSQGPEGCDDGTWTGVEAHMMLCRQFGTCEAGLGLTEALYKTVTLEV